jgi:hypothetical protein
MPIGSKYPTFQLEYNKGISHLFGSDVDFDKWKFSVFDNMNFKIGGEFATAYLSADFLMLKKWRYRTCNISTETKPFLI